MNAAIKTIVTIFFTSMLCTSTPLQAQKTMYRTVGHQIEGSEGRNIVQAKDGGYFLSYYIYYAGKFIGCISKLNCAGQVTWEKFYEEAYSAIPVDVIPQPDNGCLLLLSVREISGEFRNAVIRLDQSGNTLWTQKVDMHAASPTGCMVQDNDGSIYTIGVDSVAAINNFGTTVAKIKISGELVWVKQFAASVVDHTAKVITITSDHKIAIAGPVAVSGLLFTNVFVMTLDSDGNFLQRKIFTTYYDDEVTSICADKSGNIYLSGYSYFLNSAWDAFFIKLNSQLVVQESKFYDGATPQGEQSRYISPASDNTFAIFGDEGVFNERNPMLLKLDNQGNILWSNRYSISPQFTNYIFHGSQCEDGGFLMTGDARPANQFRVAPFIKTDAFGNMGCFTSPFNLTVRTELLSEYNSPVNSYTLLLQNDTNPVPYAASLLLTSNVAFCQSLVPCGTFNWTYDSQCPVPCYTFSENSLLADSWLWTFENGTPSTSLLQQPPQVCFPGNGPYDVTLTLTNAIGSYTISKTLVNNPDCPFTIPNIFTPNGDGINEFFEAEGLTESFTLKIFNRWGMEIFASEKPGMWWDGNYNDKNPATSGVYFYLLNLPQRDKFYKGVVELVR